MTTPAKKKQTNPVVQFANNLQKNKEKFARSLPEHVDVERFVDVAQTAILEDPSLLNDCDPDSLYAAFKRSAQAGLMPDGEEAAIIPYRGRARFQPMVQGVTRQILRSPNVAKVEAAVVLEGDARFEYQEGTEPYIEHRSERDPGVRPNEENLTHAYAIATKVVAGQLLKEFVVLTKADVEAARDEADYSESGPWVKWYGEMAKKTAIHRLAKKMDLAPEYRRAIQADVAANYGGREPTQFGTTPEEKIEDRSDTRHAELRGRLAEDRDDSGKESEEPTDDSPPEQPESSSGDTSGDSDDTPSQNPDEDREGEGKEQEEVDATDAARRIADEEGVDLSEIDGSGQGGRITASDVRDVVLPREVDDERLPDGYSLVEYAQNWYHPKLPDGTVETDVKRHRDRAVEWCQKNAEERDEVGDEAGEPTGAEARDEKESQEASPAGSWPDLDDMDLKEMRRHAAKIVRKMEAKLEEPGCWTFPELLIRVATTLYYREDDVPRDEDGNVDATSMNATRTREMITYLRDAVDDKLENGDDPMLVDLE